MYGACLPLILAFFSMGVCCLSVPCSVLNFLYRAINFLGLLHFTRVKVMRHLSHTFTFRSNKTASIHSPMTVSTLAL